MALASAKRILEECEEIDVWDIPDWTPEDLEDNDSSEEENSVDEQDDFFDQLHKLKERVQNAPRLIQSQNKYEASYTGELRDSQKKKVEVMTFELGETQKPSDYKEYLEAVSKEEMDELDRSEEFSEHQSEFPWYTSVDNEVSVA
jgi:hypothetical protein